MSPRRRQVSIAALVLVAATAIGGGIAYRAATGLPNFDPAPLESYYRALSVPPSQRVEREPLRQAIAAAAAYIRRANLPSGQFTYSVNPNPAGPDVPGYSLLRHAGAVYSLGQADAVIPDPDNAVVMRRAVDFMRACCLAPVERDGLLGIWEPPGLGLVPGPKEFKLGGAGLGLAAMASLDAVSPGASPKEEMRAVARFGQYLQRWDGDFYPKYVPSEGGLTQGGWVIYYPGEMTLGWLLLHERDPSPRLVESALSALLLMARERAAGGSVPADHWALLATARLFRIADRERLNIPREALLNHVLQICHTILEEGHAPVPRPEMDGTLVSAGRGEVTPTATRLEGLLAALAVLPSGHPVRPHVESAVHRGLGFLLRAQIRAGELAGGIPLAIALWPDDGSEAVGRFNAAATEVRIDYVQHALSAMVMYEEWTAGGVSR